MTELSRYGFAVFDCDGVILDSNRLKTDAFAETLRDEPGDRVERLLEYHAQNAGISRYHKFRLFYEEINPVADVQARVDRALARFSDIVRVGMTRCAYVPGAIDAVKALKEAGARLFVASGSDEKELNEVFGERGIAPFFEKILGSPATKSENGRKIREIVGPALKGVFFGDARSDVDAAREMKIDFVYVKGASLWEGGEAIVREQGGLIVQDFREKFIR